MKSELLLKEFYRLVNSYEKILDDFKNLEESLTELQNEFLSNKQFKNEADSILSEQDKNLPTLIGRKECAKLLDVSLTTLDKWCAEGKIPSYKIGTRVRFKREEVLSLFEETRIQKFKRTSK